jgi:hypothetical protein
MVMKVDDLMTDQGGWRNNANGTKINRKKKKICPERVADSLTPSRVQTCDSSPEFHKQLRITTKRMQPRIMRTRPRSIPNHARENRQDNHNGYSRVRTATMRWGLERLSLSGLIVRCMW